ncbi:MAG TPA: acetate uptake transporter, partial [Opitutales bacterium]|nr:acetate uptake transporter [Opitutales bacterium]
MTTVLLNLHNAGFYGMSSMILAMGIFYGGSAQVIAGIMEWKKNNTFGTVAFTSYGMFWLTLVGLVLLPKIGFPIAAGASAGTFAPMIPGPDGAGFGCYLAVWGLFTGGLFLGTLRLSRALQFVFASLTVLFFMLAAGKFTDMGDNFEHITGYEGIVCGLSACYTGLAQVLNEIYGKTVLPLGVMAK